MELVNIVAVPTMPRAIILVTAHAGGSTAVMKYAHIATLKKLTMILPLLDLLQGLLILLLNAATAEMSTNGVNGWLKKKNPG